MRPALVVLALILFRIGAADEVALARRTIQHQYDRWSKAYMANDVPTLLGLLDVEWSLTTVDKVVVSRKEYEAKLRLRASYADPTRYRTVIKSLSLRRSAADVVAVETMESRSRSGRTVLHRHEYLDVWVLRGGVWVLGSTLTRKESTAVLKSATR